MKAIVTGGAGFTGRWLVKRLLEENFEVTVLDNLSNGSESNIAEFKARIKFVKGDIRDKALVERLFLEKPKVCFHLAAAIHVQDSLEFPEETIDVNVNGTLNVMEAAKKAGSKVVFMSSALVYAPMKGKPMSEMHPTWPSSPYSASKIAGENLALSYHYAYSLPVTVLRPFTIYGPFQRPGTEGGVTSIFIKNALENKPLQVFGSGKQTRDFVFAEDCAGFIFKAGLSEKANGQILNAGSGQETSVNQLALMICGSREKIRRVGHPRPQVEIKRMQCDYSKAQRLLGWKPKTSLEKGLKLTRQWLLESSQFPS